MSIVICAADGRSKRSLIDNLPAPCLDFSSDVIRFRPIPIGASCSSADSFNIP